MHIFAINLEFLLRSYTLGFYRGEVRYNLIYCVHLKRELELLHGFDYFPWRLAKIIFEILLARGCMGARSNEVPEVGSEEHRKFMKQQEKKYSFVNVTRR